MNITVTYKTKNSENIVQIDQKQEVIAGLNILRETGKTKYKKDVDFMRSESLGKVISVHCSFEQLGIFSGDVISSIEQKENILEEE